MPKVSALLTQTTHINYLLSPPRNYTGTHLAAHLPVVSHDQINRFLQSSDLPVSQLRELVQSVLHDSPEAFLLVDDSVSDKSYSRFIEVVKRRYSGNAHGNARSMARGIGLMNLVHSSGEAGDFLPLDDRVYAPDLDGLTKNDHFPAGERVEGSGLPGAAGPGASSRGPGPRAGGAPETSALWGETLQAGGRKRQH